jgi:prephenate dehydrogenase
VISGVGLIGGSLAAALRHRFPNCRIIGVGRSAERLQKAVDAGLLDDCSTSLSSRFPADSLGVVCLPVHRIADAAIELFQSGCSAVTDAGSVKSSICMTLAERGHKSFVGAHPIAGSEHRGFEHAEPDLFAGHTCIVTPVEAEAAAVHRVHALWQAVGMKVVQLSPAEHDAVLASTSHLPHVLASIAAASVPERLLPFTGNGYRDTTRIAAGDASIWVSILLENGPEILKALDGAVGMLQQFRDAIALQDAARLERLWEVGARVRRQLPSVHPGD